MYGLHNLCNSRLEYDDGVGNVARASLIWPQCIGASLAWFHICN